TPCEEIDFFDEYTGFDSHIYDLSNIQANTGIPTGVAPMPDGTFGFVAITVVNAAGDTSVSTPVLQGSFRIIDDAGYEYRSNPVGLRSASGPQADTYYFDFDSLGPSTFSEIIGIPIIWTAPNFGIPIAGQNVGAKFNPFIVNENSIVNSCTPTTFTCSSSGMSKGINNIYRNTKDNSRLCVTTTSKGFFNLEDPGPGSLPAGVSQAQAFIGFIGLNNGSNIGSMESFIAVP
ncbi:MAG: hypothetical protein AAF462_05650, partial [Thermodesulfobacteriota bacterium]